MVGIGYRGGGGAPPSFWTILLRILQKDFIFINIHPPPLIPPSPFRVSLYASGGGSLLLIESVLDFAVSFHEMDNCNCTIVRSHSNYK